MTERPPYLAAAAAALALLALYAFTLAPTTWFWDTSEYITTAWILGLPHPPGNPLFVAVGRVWLVLLDWTGLSVAVRMHLLAAVADAGALGLWFLVAHRLLAPVLNDGRAALAGAAAALVLGGTAYTYWTQSVVSEKVYPLSVLAIALASWMALRWRDRIDEPAGLRWLLGAGYVVALGSTNHQMSLLPLPALGIFVLLVRPGVLLRRDLWVRAVPLVLIGLSFNFLLPIRAAEDPVINEGDPTCASAVDAAVAIYSRGRAGCPALADNLTRRQYQPVPVSERQAPFGDQLENWYQYFEWQWARGADASELPGSPARVPFVLLFGSLGLAGLWAVFRTDRAAAAYLGTLAVVLTFGLVVYLNFKYGYSLAPEVGDVRLHEVRERDYFYVAGFGFWGVLAGIGLAWCWGVLAERLKAPRALAWTAPVLLIAAVPLVLNARWADRSNDWSARDWAFDLLASVEPYGVLFTNGDNDTFPLWYLQEVEGIRRDVTVVVGEYLSTDWYPKQLRDLTTAGTQRPFRPADVEGLYPVADVPADPLTRLTDEQMDSVVGGTLPQDQTVVLGSTALTFPAGMYLDRRHRLVLAIIRDSLGQRPVYFSSSGGMMADMGLRRFAVRQGLASKLVLADPETVPGLVKGSDPYGGEWFDLERSLRLYHDVYRYRGLRERDVWPDRATLNIPWHFYALALQLSDVVRQTGDEAAARALEIEAADFAVVAQGGRLGTPEEAG